MVNKICCYILNDFWANFIHNMVKKCSKYTEYLTSALKACAVENVKTREIAVKKKFMITHDVKVRKRNKIKMSCVIVNFFRVTPYLRDRDFEIVIFNLIQSYSSSILYYTSFDSFLKF